MPRLNEVLDADTSSMVSIGPQEANRLRAVATVSWLRNLPQRAFPIGRFIEVNRAPAPGTLEPTNSLPSIEILVACAEKDLNLLSSALVGALESTNNPVARISLVVPEAIVAATADAVAGLINEGHSIEVVPETQLVSSESIGELREAYGWRFGWALQQMLRNRFITHRSQHPTLVVDADTVLCFPRTWIREDGVQVMTPTWEFNPPYYSYLETRLGTSAKPQYTFIPHHMLIQPMIFIEANERAGTGSDEALLNAVLAQASDPNPSSFCLIYEIYAQWLMLNYRGKVQLERWSNRFVRRSEQTFESVPSIVEGSRALGYCSVSFHSWS